MRTTCTSAVTNSFHQIMFGMESDSLWILVKIQNRQAIKAIGQDDMDANWALVFWLTVICAEPFCILCVIYHFASPNIISHYQGNFVHCYGVVASQAIILFINSSSTLGWRCHFDRFPSVLIYFSVLSSTWISKLNATFIGEARNFSHEIFPSFTFFNIHWSCPLIKWNLDNCWH